MKFRKWETQEIFLVYIRGDLLVLLPLLIIILSIGFFSFDWMFIVLGLFVAVRQLGEMIYWLLHQFGDRKYRPYDFGFAKLDNSAVYVIYQTFATTYAVIGLVIAALILRNGK